MKVDLKRYKFIEPALPILQRLESAGFEAYLVGGCVREILRAEQCAVADILTDIDITTNTRPQFATVRYKVMSAPERKAEAAGEIVTRKIPKGVSESGASCVSVTPVPPKKSISDAEILVVGGRGLQKEADLEMVKELAALLGGDWATTRPLVEKGWNTNDRQIGLSGRTVRPRLIITCGVSGAIQFTACMNGSDHIVAINTDPKAPIFDVAQIGIVGDLYQIVPELIRQLKEDRA